MASQQVDLPLGQQLRRRKPIVFRKHHHPGEELGRTLTTFQLMMFGVGATVGTGIFFVLSESVPDAGPGVIVSFLIAGLAAGLSALCYAEMASSIPVSGSTYSYAYHAMGELAAVAIAACVLLEYGVAAAAVAVGWSGYLGELIVSTTGVELPTAITASFVPDGDGATAEGFVNLPAVVLVFLCMLLLIRGATESARANAIMVLIKLGVLLLFVIVALTGFTADHFSGFFASGIGGMTAAAGTIFFSFIGLDAVATAGEEVKDPQRALPRAIIGALIIVTSVYILVAFAGVAAKETEWFSTEPAQSAGLSQILNDVTGTTVWGTILAAGAVISIFSVTLVTLYGQTRILFAIGRDGLISRRFTKVHPRTLTPTFTTIVASVVIALIAGFVPADYLWDTVSIGTLVAFSAVAAGVMILRRTHPDLERPFRVPGYPVTPVLTILICGWIVIKLPVLTWMVFLGWLAVVVAFYLVYGRRHAALNTTDDPEDFAESRGDEEDERV